MEGTAAKGFRHDHVADRGYATMRQSTKLATKLATKTKSHAKPGSARWVKTVKVRFALGTDEQLKYSSWRPSALGHSWL